MTDRPEETWPKRDQSPGKSNIAAANNQAAVPAPPVISSVAAKAAMSRAKLIMDKASAQPTDASKSTTDVLETAVRLGVKIIAASKMFNFLKQQVSIPGVEKPADTTASVMKSLKAVPMVGAYIKVEAIDQRTKPIYKVFRAWPDLVLEPGTGCPFRPSHLSVAISDRMMQDQKAKTQQQKQQGNNNQIKGRTPVPSPIPSPLPNFRTPSTQYDEQMMRQHGRIIAGPVRRSGIASWSRITPQTVGQTATTGTGNMQTLVGRGANHHHNQGIKRKIMFCEVCGVEYENVADHIKSHTHERFMSDPDNFKELMSVITSLPKISDLEAANVPTDEVVKKDEAAVMKRDTNKKQDYDAACDDDEEKDETSAYDVTHLRNRMSVATITAGPEDNWSMLNNAFDVEL